jgi:hypothetical protein
MGNRPHDYRFRIDAFTPSTLPMARLSEYMADFAAILGHQPHVHFLGLEKGSAVLRARVDEEVWPEVEANLRHADDPKGGRFRIYERLDRRLAEDGAVGEIINFREMVVLRLAGRDRPPELDFPSFRERSYLDGELVRIGGKDTTVHATIVDGARSFRCQLSRDLARQLAGMLFNGRVRIYGNARWKLLPESEWSLEQFDADAFEILEGGSLIDSITRLHERGYRLDAEGDVHGHLLDLRKDH